MKITINISKEEAEHLLPTHTFYDCCMCVENIMLKVQKECEKQIGKKRIDYWGNKKIKKPVVVKFRKADGSIVKLRVKKIIAKPSKINFPINKKKYKK